MNLPAKTLRPHVGEYLPDAPADLAEGYRKHALALFGSIALPPVIYKGITYPARSL